MLSTFFQRVHTWWTYKSTQSVYPSQCMHLVQSAHLGLLCNLKGDG